MYKYYFKTDENNIIAYFNEAIQKPESTDVFDQEREERHFQLDLFDYQKRKWKYKNNDGKMELKSPAELEPTTEEIEAGKQTQLLTYIKKELPQKLVEMADNKDSLDDLFDWIDAKKIELKI